MRRASSSSPMSPTTDEATPPSAVISSTRLSRPRQDSSRRPSRSWRRLGTPVGRRSLTTTATPEAARARPMPSRLPQPVISAARAPVMASISSASARADRDPPPRGGGGGAAPRPGSRPRPGGRFPRVGEVDRLPRHPQGLLQHGQEHRLRHQTLLAGLGGGRDLGPDPPRLLSNLDPVPVRLQRLAQRAQALFVDHLHLLNRLNRPHRPPTPRPFPIRPATARRRAHRPPAPARGGPTGPTRR